MRKNQNALMTGVLVFVCGSELLYFSLVVLTPSRMGLALEAIAVIS
jgi:hypothetical protein